MKNKNLNGSFIKVPFTTGIIQHGTNPPDDPIPKIWFLLENKWFEIEPHDNYRAIYEEMVHVCGVFWANDEFYDAPRKKAMLQIPDFASVSLTAVISHVSGTKCIR